MKKILAKVTLPVLLVLAGTMLSCNREAIDDNPNYNPETREVLADFVLSVATGGGSQSSQPETKMTASAVQLNTNFRGITEGTILTYIMPSGAAYMDSTSTAASKRFNMGDIYTNGEITAADNKTSSSNRVLQLSIPVGVNAVLFYGKAAFESGTGGQGKAYGYTVMDVKDRAKDTEFKAVRRMPEDKVASYDATARLMIFVINRIMSSSIGAATVDSDGFPANQLPAVSWRDYGLQYEIAMGIRPGTADNPVPLEEILGKIYSSFTTIKAGEYRSGSSAAVKWMMEEMSSVVKSVVDATPTSAREANAKRLAGQIILRMGRYFNSSWQYQGYDAIKSVVLESNILSEDEWNDANEGFVGAADLNGYPYEDFGVPEGAAQLKVDENGVFSYKHPNAALVTPGAEFEPRKYVYPAELLYFVNSPVRVTDKADLSVSDYPNGVNPWDDDTSAGNKWTAGNWALGSVTSTTRGIAVRDNINYGVALLKTSVDWSEDAKTAGYLNDNRGTLVSALEGDRQIALDTEAKFVLKGVLVGGVNPRMNWQFIRKEISGPYSLFDGVIYDDAIANTAIPTPANGENYTLVYDNYDSSLGTNQNYVYVALEFVNNGDAFWGRDNLIRNGGTFYLVGQLVNDEAHQSSITWPTYYQVPPIYGVDGDTSGAAGQSMKIPRVFIQDFMTTAKFRIGLNSLKNAYLTVPDLRSSQMSLGLSVDLSWQNGYTYDIEL